MILSDREAAMFRKLLSEMEQGLNKTRYKSYLHTRIRKMRLTLNKAERREKNTHYERVDKRKGQTHICSYAHRKEDYPL